MVVNDSPGDECRIAILQDGHLEELYTERTATATNVGNIYKGRVTNVESAIQAAFVDFGKAKNGFLHISDLHPQYFPGRERTERVGKKIPRRERPLIQHALRRGEQVLVQVLKEGLGTKGPTLTSYLSVPGRLMVMMPHMDRVGVSRKIEDEEKRREMRKVLDSLDLPEGFGFILRTAGFDAPKIELKRDVSYLMRLWKVMDERIRKAGAPCELYTESDLLIRIIRDVVRPSISAIVVDSMSAYNRASQFLRVVAPRSAPKVLLYTHSAPIFHAFDIERQIELIHSRNVPLPSGGQIVIDQTEALVAIDVNSGKSRSARDSETNAYETNCEAADEICRQLRLRDLGGLIINDLIDMRSPRHRRDIEERFRANLKLDRAKTTTLRLSQFGILEMTRQRMRPSLRSSHFVSCQYCSGHGEVKSPEYVGADATRQLGFLLQVPRIARVEMACSPRVASVLLSNRRRELVRVESSTGKKIDVRVSESIATDRVDFYAYDERNADVDLAELPALTPPTLQAIEESMKKFLAAKTDGKPVEAPDDGELKKRSRRRRRRRSGPADASAVALSGEFDEQWQDEPDETEKAEPAPVVAQAAAAPARSEAGDGQDDRRGDEGPRRSGRRRGRRDSAIRIHELARQIDVPSREILQQCESIDEIDVKNHMSSVTPQQAAVIRGLFVEGDASAPPPTAAQEERSAPMPAAEADRQPGRRRRRGKRGGRRRRGKPAASPVAPSSPAAEAAPTPSDGAPVAAEPQEGRNRKKRRRRRRGGAPEGIETAGGNGQSAGSPPSEAAPGHAASPAAANDGADATAADSAAPESSRASQARKRRTLYRRRVAVSPTARDVASKTADD